MPESSVTRYNLKILIQSPQFTASVALPSIHGKEGIYPKSSLAVIDIAPQLAWTAVIYRVPQKSLNLFLLSKTLLTWSGQKLFFISIAIRNM